MNIIDYFGNFHPLAVHLPIGVLSVFLLLGFFIPRQELAKSYHVLRLMLLFSALTATASALTGYILYWAGSYEGNLVTGHQVLGIALTLLNWVILLKLQYLLNCRIVIYRSSLVFVLVLMLLTGHAGGSLTHGEDFLTPPPPNAWFQSVASPRSPIDLNSTALEAVSVIFDEKCVSCHGANKQKGKLRLDEPAYIRQGGKSGDFITDETSNSLMVQRILLPMEDEDHMPPKERKQLSQAEVDFLVWWVASGASFETSLEEMALPDSIQGILSSVQENPETNIPAEEVSAAAEEVLKQLRDLGLIVTPVAANSNYLSVNFVNVLPENVEAAMSQLVNIREQLLDLDVAYQNLDMNSWQQIGSLSNLRMLDLRNTNFGDESALNLDELLNLKSLNLVGTNVSYNGLEGLQQLSGLEKLYIYRTHVSTEQYQQICQMFPGAQIDTGNYIVPVLASDTTIYTLQ
jgi:mono/diheme cytochrome c family protein